MEKPKISIIVPIYNMELYLRKCLDSIKAQTFTDWECILVDDGSTDSSGLICDEYASEDARFRVVHKENGGVSSARNAGLDAAIGDYIGWVDPDDWTEPEMFATLYSLIEKEDAEIAQIGFWREYKDHSSVKHLTKEIKIMDGFTAMREMGFDRLPNYLWNRLHKREIITCKFPEGRNFEDLFVYGQWLKNVRKIVLDPTPMYHYLMRSGSIVHGDAARNRYDYFLSCLDRMEMIEYTFSGKKDDNRRNAYINKSAVNAAKSIARDEKNKMKRDGAIFRISQKAKEYPLPSPEYMAPKTWWRARLLRNNPMAFGRLMRWVHLLDFDSKRRSKKMYD